jgi:hypothetical protein
MHPKAAPLAKKSPGGGGFEPRALQRSSGVSGRAAVIAPVPINEHAHG